MMPRQIAKIAAFKDGQLLMGKRRDNGKWTQPGGHLEPGESPTEAAHRELKEETGLDSDGMMHRLDRKTVKDGQIVVHAFKTEVTGEPRTEFDPDEEFTEMRWLDPESMPAEVMRNLHSKPDVVLEALGARGRPWASFDSDAA
jgi:8-oxo-dGTP pyrophosphatase MutT (NUDIX family)